jgi:hypothetical protein
MVLVRAGEAAEAYERMASDKVQLRAVLKV